MHCTGGRDGDCTTAMAWPFSKTGTPAAIGNNVAGGSMKIHQDGKESVKDKK